MDKYEMYQVKRAIKTCQEGFNGRDSMIETRYLKTRQDVFKLLTICIGCKKPLGRYEEVNQLAFCYSCRKVFFPRTIHSKKIDVNRNLL